MCPGTLGVPRSEPSVHTSRDPGCPLLRDLRSRVQGLQVSPAPSPQVTCPGTPGVPRPELRRLTPASPRWEQTCRMAPLKGPQSPQDKKQWDDWRQKLLRAGSVRHKSAHKRPQASWQDHRFRDCKTRQILRTHKGTQRASRPPGRLLAPAFAPPGNHASRRQQMQAEDQTPMGQEASFRYTGHQHFRAEIKEF